MNVIVHPIDTEHLDDLIQAGVGLKLPEDPRLPMRLRGQTYTASEFKSYQEALIRLWATGSAQMNVAISIKKLGLSQYLDKERVDVAADIALNEAEQLDALSHSTEVWPPDDDKDVDIP